jgi:peptide deformylase
MNNAPPLTLELVHRNADILWAVAPPVTDIRAQVLPALREMRRIMRKGAIRAIGLSAPQVGIPLRFFVTEIKGIPLVVNPEILRRSIGKTAGLEGCVSHGPKVWQTYVARHTWVHVRFTNARGELEDHTLHELAARVFQHEADHLDGKNIFER